jgi:phosphate transport system substrate-binding protein
MNLFAPQTRVITSWLLAAAILMASFIHSGSCLAADTVRINGSGSALDMLKPFIEAYLKTNRNVRIEMEKPLGSTGAIKALLAGALDVVAASRTLKPEEIAKGALQSKFGRTPLVIVTEKSVNKTNITTKELEDIYSGTTTTWQSGEIIRLVLRPKEDMDSKILSGLSPGMNSALVKSQSRPGMITAVTDFDAYTTISRTAGAVGASGLTSLITGKPSLNALSLNGVAPTPQNLASGIYPLAKEISFVTGSRTPPEAQKFLNFVYSPQGRAIAAKSGVLVTGEKKVSK